MDEATTAVERDNPSLKGVLPKDYARPALDKQRLGQLIDLVTNIHLGGSDNHARDILGRVYEYFLGQFASAEGKKGSEFYTPRCIVKLLVEMCRPTRAGAGRHRPPGRLREHQEVGWLQCRYSDQLFAWEMLP